MSSAIEVLERYVTTTCSAMRAMLDALDECARQENATTLTDECELVRHWRQMPEVPIDALSITMFADASVSFIDHILTDHAHHHERAYRVRGFDGMHRQIEDQLDACFADMSKTLGEVEQ